MAGEDLLADLDVGPITAIRSPRLPRPDRPPRPRYQESNICTTYIRGQRGWTNHSDFHRCAQMVKMFGLSLTEWPFAAEGSGASCRGRLRDAPQDGQ